MSVSIQSADHLRARCALGLVQQISGADISGRTLILKSSKRNFTIKWLDKEVTDSRKAKVIGEMGESYFASVREAPLLIHRAGLAQALAFMMAKKESRELVATQILHYLDCCVNRGEMDCGVLDKDSSQSVKSMMNAILDSDPIFLMHATMQCQKLLTWLKLFSEATFKKTDGQAGENGQTVKGQAYGD